ncbi:MAG TPA: M14 family zinc carboxypeptidase, partial [Candidatus Eisenbacteria bacterium]|nr:M14 family zinc carboxypeptidase [Candidatus Eisenbacteria bacterium]
VQGHATGQPSGWWRKNRRPNADGSTGVDLNRNYSYRWGWDNVGSSPIPSSEVYRGTGPFSEPEAAALRDFMAAHAFTIAASFHSYGELFLYPWGYAQLDTPDHAVFHAFGDSVAAQNGYRAGNPKSGAISLTNGDMDDWVYGDAALKPALFGFTFELNTSDQGGFAPPDGLIPPTCALNWGPVLTLLRYADEPRRTLPPARPEPPWYVGAGGGVDLHWSYLADDPRNPAVRHDVRRIGALTIAADDAEAGVAAWDSAGFSWSALRSASGTRSFWSGAANNRVSVLTSRAGVDAASGDSLAVQAYWDLESDYDYWYAEASADGGGTWSSLAGSWTTTFNPFGKNEGNGVTGGSGGAFRRASFAWGAFAGKQVLVRFRCVTNGSNFGEGLYLDDIAPTAFESGITDQDTQSAERIFHLSPAPPAVTWFQVRAVDAEGQRGAWSARSPYEPGITAAELPVSKAPPFDRLLPNAPNPFNPRTELHFSLGAGVAGAYRLELYDAGGRRVALLQQGWDSGLGATHSAGWDGRDDRGLPAASGVYLVRLQSVRGTTSSKITLLR